jgi:hypothetical protein
MLFFDAAKMVVDGWPTTKRRRGAEEAEASSGGLQLGSAMKNMGCCRKIVALVVLFQTMGSRAADTETVVADFDHRSLGNKQRKSEYSTQSMKKAKKHYSSSKYYKFDNYYYKSTSMSGSGGGKKHSEKGGSHASKPSYEDDESNSDDDSSSGYSSEYTKKYKKIKKRSSDDSRSKPDYEASKFLKWG